MNELQRIANFLGYRLINYGTYVRDQTRSVTHYRKRIDYPLDERSLVVDIGGLTGDWSQQIYSRYACNIDIYEPHPTLYHHALKELFRHNGMVRIFGYGLSDKSEKMTLYGDGYVSSLYPMQNTMNHQIAEIRKASDVFNERYSNKVIDVLKINVEGAEYEILPDLIQNYDMSKIRNIQIQFHQVVDGYAEKREKIQHDLAALGFVQTWNVEWAFENWENV